MAEDARGDDAFDDADAALRTRAMYVKVKFADARGDGDGGEGRRRGDGDGGAVIARFRDAGSRHGKTGDGKSARSASSIRVNGAAVASGEAEITFRREREGAWMSMDEVRFVGDFDFELALDREMWAMGTGRKNEDGTWSMVMTPGASLTRTVSREAERVFYAAAGALPKSPKTAECRVEFGIVGMSQDERVCLVNQIDLPLEKVLGRAQKRIAPVMVGETSAMLPAIDEHTGISTASVSVDAVNAAARQHHKTHWSSFLDRGDMDNLAILSKMRQRYESMMDYQDDYPADPVKLSWFDASLRLGIGVGLGVILGAGLGVGVVVNGFRAISTKRLRSNPKADAEV
jgi:hypothetical protein